MLIFFSMCIVYSNENEDSHEQEVGFLVHKDIVKIIINYLISFQRHHSSGMHTNIQT